HRTCSEFHGASYPRVHSLSGNGFLNHQMCSVSTRGNNAAAQNFRDNLGWFAGTVHAIVGKLVGRESQSVERTEAGFVTEKGAAGGSFDALIEIDKAPSELASEERANGGLAGTHKTG